MTLTGTCLCGGTTVTVSSDHDSQILCHCNDCKKTSGSSNSTNILAKIADVEISGSSKEYNSKAASGNTVTRVFCGTCGSALAHKTPAFGDSMAVQTGNFPAFQSIPIAAELFVKDRFTGLVAVPNAGQKETM